MGQVHLIDHPMIQHKLTIMRDKNTSTKDFRELLNEISMLMTYEITREFPLKDIEIETPICKSVQKAIAGKKVSIIPVLRAGLGMVEGMLKIIPSAKIGHIGLYRDPETFKPVEYYCKVPNKIEDRQVIVVDPMLATGGSASAAIQFIKDRGGNNIKLMNLIAAPEGIEFIRKNHPDVDIYVAGIDDCLNDSMYIVPGLGDAGDRIFGTL